MTKNLPKVKLVANHNGTLSGKALSDIKKKKFPLPLDGPGIYGLDIHALTLGGCL